MFIGVDLGGTNIAIGLVDEEFCLVYENSIPTRSERSPEEVIRDIIAMIKEVIAESDKEVKAIGIGIPGIAEPGTGNVILCVNLRWANIPLKSILEHEFNIPVFIDNDATVAAVAEYKAGAMKNVSSGVMLTIGTGIGGGIISEGKVIRGFNGIASEVGHMIVGENFYNCNCGRNGCLETFASSTALINYAKKLMQQGNKTIILDMVKGDLEQINGKIIFESAKLGDFVANEAVDRLVRYLAIGINNIAAVIDPEVFVIGGGIASAGQFLLEKVKIAAQEYKYIKAMPIGDIVLAKFNNDAGIIGAAALCEC